MKSNTKPTKAPSKPSSPAIPKPKPDRAGLTNKSAKRIQDLKVMVETLENFRHETDNLKHEATLFYFCAQDRRGFELPTKAEGGFIPDEVAEMHRWLRQRVMPLIYKMKHEISDGFIYCRKALEEEAGFKERTFLDFGDLIKAAEQKSGAP